MNMFKLPSASRSKVIERWPALRAAGAMLAELMFWPARFDDPQVEREFTIDYGRRFAEFRRAALVLGTLIWACFGWWEINLAQSNEVFRPYFPEIFAFRCLGVLVAGVGIVLAFRLQFDKDAIAHRILLTGLAGMCMCLLVQTILAPRPVNFTHFFVGFYLIFFYLFGFLRLRAKATFLLTTVVICLIVAAQLITQSLEADNFVAGMFYLLNVALLGYSVNVSEERHVRDRFVAVRLLANSNDALQGANAELAKKHQDLERARRDQQDRSDALITLREQQREDAERSSQAKSRFLAAAAHDLRQPMHALNLFLAAAGEALDKRDLDESVKLIGEARKASVLMARLFNAVLDLSKLESGHVKPNYSCIDLDAVAQESIEQLAPFAESCGVKLRYRPRRIDQKRALVRSDADWAPRVLSNLISNGIKYSDPLKTGRCTVIVGVVRTPNYVRVDVVDNGIGIASQHWDAIFQPFVQIGNPERDREKGLGLGLSIVNAVVSLLEGHRIELKSVVGHGSRFSVRLPAVESPAGCDAVAPLVELVPSRALLRGLYVILVEDDGLVRASMNALFVQWGVLCESARSLAEFDALLDTVERLPDLVISDYRLPEFSTAHDVVRMLSTRLTRPVPCLVITGETTATAAGTLPERYVLSKPISADELAARMLELTEGRRMGV
ncbi:hybrid sensor histidine kinase/response regulator [Burkholderia sp. Ac-20365]|uniref:ATP-binding response regulator n=1 Tax=Burkholderia sp. Ac-20365 TaxID=2703897 RepID=UPI00197B36FB|nr:hybrid sensor histidine kinase/response regulator [Burkholderia sp. Ac-20365]MBN3763861.1 hybrid sensor histidine kinase/response regulator [Burkholderia sp. Ac-20365]